MARPTDIEIAQAIVDFTPEVQPYSIDTRVVWRRFTPAEIRRIRSVSRANDYVADLREEMIAGATTNVNDPRFVAGLEFLKTIMIPSVWADTAAADVRIAAIRARE